MRTNPYTLIGTNNSMQVNTAKELMRNANLDWKVKLENVIADTGNGFIEIPDRFATVKYGENPSVLSVVGTRYKVFQNQDIFGALDDIVGSGAARYGAAGELDGGKVVWTVLELPNNISINGDKHNAYVVARTSHDGSSPFQLTPMVNRLSCTNQINAAMLDGKKKGLYYSLRHSTNNFIDPDNIKSVFKIIDTDIEKYSTVSNWLIGNSFNDGEFSRFLQKVYPMPAKIEFASEELLSTGERIVKSKVLKSRDRAMLVWNGETGTQENIANTMFAAFQTIVEAEDHFSRKAEKQSERLILGKDVSVKSRALQLLGVR